MMREQNTIGHSLHDIFNVIELYWTCDILHFANRDDASRDAHIWNIIIIISFL